MAGDLPFPQSLLELIQSCVPTLQAAEVLLFFASHPDRDFSVEEVVVCMRPAVITVPAVREYTALFAAQRLVTEANGRFTLRSRCQRNSSAPSVSWRTRTTNGR